MIAGIDSMVLIYAGVVPSKKGVKVDKELQTCAKILLHKLRSDTVLLPTIAVTELLVPVPSAQKGLLIASLAKRFVCPQFDMRAASIAAELWVTHKKMPQDLQYKSRHVLRSDAMIIAAVKSVGATEFYSHDKQCRALAKHVMKACNESM
ncbi:MAG: hypothetical protein ACC628_12770 [Pirellulaceae bacterium]